MYNFFMNKLENNKIEIGTRNSLIDYLKAICVIFVCYTHCIHSESFRQLFIFPYFIAMAVPIFMLISGLNFSNSQKRFENKAPFNIYIY